MADAIVQTIKIEVDGAEEAAAEIKKVGEATEDVQKTAATTAGGTQELGKGLDGVTQKSSLTRGEMRALGGVMRQLGAGEAASLAIQFNRMRNAFGTVGVAVLGAAMAFSALMRSAAEAKEASDSVERLSKSLSDTPERLQAMQSAFKAAGVSIADFEKAFDALAFKVIERSASMAEASAQSSKKVIDAELAAAKAAQAASPHPELFEQQIKRLEISQKQEAAYLAEAQAAKAYENSQAALVPQLERAAQGQKTVLDSGVKTESLVDSLVQMFAKGGQSVVQFGDDLQKGAPSAEKMADKLNALFNSLDPAAQLKLKTGLKGLGVPDSAVNSITTTTEKYAKLKKAADDAAKFNASPAGQALKEFDAAVQRSIEMVEGWGRSLKIAFADAVIWVKQTASDLPNVIGQFFATAPGNAWGWIKETWEGIGTWFSTKITEAKALIAGWVTTPIDNAWGWIKDIWGGIGTWISTKIDEAKAFINAWVTTPVANAFAWLKEAWNANVPKWAQIGGGSSGGAEGSGAATQGAFAGGGLLGGRGTGTSDSNLAWVSRGEYITPARAVAQPGVLAFLEALRRSGGDLRDVLDGMGRFALGGMVRTPLAIPAFAGGGAPRNLGRLELGLPGGGTATVYTDERAVEALRKAAALAQVRSGGRKPSRYS